MSALTAILGAAAVLLTAAARPAVTPKPRTMADVLAASTPADWRPLDPESTLYVELRGGRVVVELASQFAPKHVANIRTLARERYFDGLAIVRAQDNYVVQWGDPDGKRPLGKARASLAAELARSAAGLRFTVLAERDAYAPEVGFVDGLPAARDVTTQQAWLAHCYGVLGVGRDDAADSGSGAELYVVIGHSPRHLDRNVTVAGRVVSGIDLLSTLPRGTGAMGFYERPEERVSLRSVRVAADVPAAERSDLEALRTDTPTFAALVESRRNRTESWFLTPTGHIDLCNVPLPVRARR